VVLRSGEVVYDGVPIEHGEPEHDHVHPHVGSSSVPGVPECPPGQGLLTRPPVEHPVGSVGREEMRSDGSAESAEAVESHRRTASGPVDTRSAAPDPAARPSGPSPVPTFQAEKGAPA
jgi:hypothetical protein